MSSLAEQSLEPCTKQSGALDLAQAEKQLSSLEHWSLGKEDGVLKLSRSYRFGNFNEALGFANQVGEQADKEDHHPSITVEWGRATVVWWTHSISGLCINDFIMAARCDVIFEQGTAS